MANKKVDKKSETKEVKKLDGIETMRKFVKEMQKINSDDFSPVMPLLQITWKETTNQGISPLELLNQNVLVGNVGIKLKKRLSDVCLIIELRTNTGIYSTKVICENAAYKPDKDGIWGVNPLSFHKM